MFRLFGNVLWILCILYSYIQRVVSGNVIANYFFKVILNKALMSYLHFFCFVQSKVKCHFRKCWTVHVLRIIYEHSLSCYFFQYTVRLGCAWKFTLYNKKHRFTLIINVILFNFKSRDGKYLMIKSEFVKSTRFTLSMVSKISIYLPSIINLRFVPIFGNIEIERCKYNL